MSGLIITRFWLRFSYQSVFFAKLDFPHSLQTDRVCRATSVFTSNKICLKISDSAMLAHALMVLSAFRHMYSYRAGAPNVFVRGPNKLLHNSSRTDHNMLAVQNKEYQSMNVVLMIKVHSLQRMVKLLVRF